MITLNYGGILMNQRLFSCYASAAFGTEGLVSTELKSFHLSDVHAENGGVRFSSDISGIITANIKSRICDRIYIILAEGRCLSFEDLFQTVNRIPWELYAKGNEAFNISCKCSRSQLMSTRDCQSISKKALIERLKNTGKGSIFPEDKGELSVMISVRNNNVKVLLNTSGAALSRRGYRTWNGEAPLRETLAASLVALSPWKPGVALHDPCCGTGTILVEAALHNSKKAPGLNRPFAFEQFFWIDQKRFNEIKKGIQSEAIVPSITRISGSDIDSEALKLSEKHIHQAGLDHQVNVFQCPLQNLQLTEEKGVFICNPPYGERMNNQKECHELYHDLFLLKQRHPNWSFCAITSDPAFERAFGKRATRKRRLYNGRLECTYYIYE